jgi:hypothetical protein
MRFPVLLILLVISTFLSVSSFGRRVAVTSLQLPETKSVYLGGAVFQPANLSAKATSKLIISVATGAQVPAIGADNANAIRAVIAVNENTNTSSISYTVTPSQIQKVDLRGEGRSSSVEFNFTVDPQNTKGGSISYRATLVGLENATGRAQTSWPAAIDAALTIDAPPSPTPTPAPSATPEK